MQGIFVAGTGTEIGKTVVATAIAHGVADKRLGYWKPVSSGTPTDTDFVAQHATSAHVFPALYTYQTPISPHAAAKQENKPAVNLQALRQHWLQLQEDNSIDLLLIEAAGGMLVPLNEELQTWLDFLTITPELALVLVSDSGLGTLNHTAMTVNSLRDCGFNINAIVLNGDKFYDNELIVRRMHRDIPVLTFAKCEGISANKDWTERCQTFANTLLQHIITHEDVRDWQRWDHLHVWHPFTQHHCAPPPEAIVSASGVWLQTSAGDRLLDGISSWWTCNIGHGRVQLAQACAAQLRTCDHVAFAGLTHEPAARLAHEILLLTKNSMERVFFSDNGSTAVEIAAKIAYQHKQNLQQKEKSLFLTLQGGYHGDTIGAMSLGNAPRMHQPFLPLLFKTLRAKPATCHPSVHCPAGSADLAARLAELQKLVEENADRLCAIVIEPLVQGAGGMMVQETRWLQEVGRLARAHDITLIFDEVFTALGRTGYDFAFQRAGVVPDIVCLAKGLTGGTLPLALTLVKEKFFSSFWQAKQPFMHGHTFTANPIACRAALQTLRILRDEGLAARALLLEKCFQHWLEQNKEKIANPRALGAILAFELAGVEQERSFERTVAIMRLAARHQLYLRPLGNIVYFAPPLTIDDAELAIAFKALERVIT